MLDSSDVRQAMEIKRQQRHYVGVCVDNKDPLQLGRLKVRVPELYGEVPNDHLPWCNPSLPFGGPAGDGADGAYGFFFIPVVGAKVRIVLWRNHPWFPVWQGVHWTEGNTPEEAKLNPPTNYVLKTPKQHLMDFNDTPSSTYMRLKDLRGNYIILHTSEDSIYMFALEDIIVQASTRHHETSQSRRIKVTDSLDIDVGGNINIKAGGTINIDGVTINLNSGAANPAQPDTPVDVEIQ